MKTMTRRLVWMVCGLSATSATAQLAPRVEVSVETSRGEMSVLTMPGWKPAGDVMELAQLFTVMPPPPPPA